MSNHSAKTRYHLFELETDDIELDLLVAHRKANDPHKPPISNNALRSDSHILGGKVIIDVDADRKFMITSECQINHPSGVVAATSAKNTTSQYLSETTIDSQHLVYEVFDSHVEPIDELEVATAIGIHPSDLKGMAGEPISSDGIHEDGFMRVKSQISDENIHRMMKMQRQRIEQETGSYSAALPDKRSRLQGHALLNEKITWYQDRQMQDIASASAEWRKQIEAMQLNGAVKDDALERVSSHYDGVIDNYREKLMQASLEKSGFLVIEEQLLDFKEAEMFTERRFSLVHDGNFMELGDIEGTLLVGRASADTLTRIQNKLGDDPLDDKLIQAIVIKQKEVDVQTNIYLVEDIDKDLWIRGEQVDVQGRVINRNQESFAAAGLDASRFTQGISHTDGDKLLQMQAQITANNIRRMASSVQLKEQEKLVMHHNRPTPAPTPRQSGTQEQAHIDRTYHVERLSDQQANEFKYWGSLSNHVLDEDIEVNSLWQITSQADDDMVILANMSGSTSSPQYAGMHENMVRFVNKSGHLENSNNWIDGYTIGLSDKLSADEVREGLESLESLHDIDNPEVLARLNALQKGKFGDGGSKYPYYGGDEDDDVTKPVAYGKTRRNTVKH